MHRIITILLLSIAVGAEAQVSSSTYRDASGGGPYPFYLGVGYTFTSNHRDYEALKNAFQEYSNRGFDGNERLRGVEVLGGFTYKPEGSKFPGWPIVLEFRYRYLTRKTRAEDMSLRMTVNQLSAGLGARYAAFPFVFQLQVGPILSYKEEFEISPGAGASEQRIINKSNPSFGFNGISTIFRLGILDPAGTEGGLGLYVEVGHHAPKSTENLAQVMTTLDPQHDTLIERESSYWQLSAGLLLPIAIKIK